MLALVIIGIVILAYLRSTGYRSCGIPFLLGGLFRGPRMGHRRPHGFMGGPMGGGPRGPMGGGFRGGMGGHGPMGGPHGRF